MRASATSIGLALGLFLAGTATAWSKPYHAIKGESTLKYVLIHPMHKVTGVANDFACEVDLSPDTVSSKITVSAPVAAFDSRNSSRDSHMLEVVNAIKYPRVEFASGSVKPEGDGYAVAGTLTFHGVSRPVLFHVTPRFKGDKVEITGGFDIKLSDFKVKRPSLMFVPVKDSLRIEFDLFSQR
ncbi:MAG: hypothetical protein JWP91_3716 [Fibrobacteres bacterium]|nr:hypothetical protein [Fibrobacterota bacterium]